MSAEAQLIGWRVASVTARNLLAVNALEVGKYCLVMAGAGELYQAVKAGTGSSCWAAESADGSETTTAQADATSALAALNGPRIFAHVPTVVDTGLLLITNVAYWVYQGYFPTAVTTAKIAFHIVTAGVGAQTAEMALASSAAAPNRAATQVLTKIAGGAIGGGVINLASATGIQAFTLAGTIPAGTHLWAGIRTAMATDQPTLLARANDFGQGIVRSTAAAGALTGAGPWTASSISQALTAQCPILSVTKD